MFVCVRTDNYSSICVVWWSAAYAGSQLYTSKVRASLSGAGIERASHYGRLMFILGSHKHLRARPAVCRLHIHSLLMKANSPDDEIPALR